MHWHNSSTQQLAVPSITQQTPSYTDGTTQFQASPLCSRTQQLLVPSIIQQTPSYTDGTTQFQAYHNSRPHLTPTVQPNFRLHRYAATARPQYHTTTGPILHRQYNPISGFTDMQQDTTARSQHPTTGPILHRRYNPISGFTANHTTNKTNSMVWVRERTIPTERPSLVGEVIANFVDKGCHVVSVTDPYGRILSFLHKSRY
jgi:hypothetical protein